MPHPYLLTSRIEIITAPTARTLRTACHYDRQRKLSEKHTEMLAVEMVQGTFLAGTTIAMGVYPDGHMVILNGNHTLEAVALSGIPIALNFVYFPVNDDDDAGRIYAIYDTHRRKTWGESYRALGLGGDVGGNDWPTKVGGAVAVIAQNFHPDKSELHTSRDFRNVLIRYYQKESDLLFEAFTGAPVSVAKYLRRRAVLAVALETMRHQPSAAAEFWSELARDDGLRVGNPRRALLNYLRTHTITAGSVHTQAKATALAWNAFYRGVDLEFIKPNAAIGVRIQGTPWMREGYNPIEGLTVSKPYMAAIQADVSHKQSFTTGVTIIDGEERPVVLFAA